MKKLSTTVPVFRSSNEDSLTQSDLALAKCLQSRWLLSEDNSVLISQSITNVSEMCLINHLSVTFVILTGHTCALSLSLYLEVLRRGARELGELRRRFRSGDLLMLRLFPCKDLSLDLSLSKGITP